MDDSVDVANPLEPSAIETADSVSLNRVVLKTWPLVVLAICTGGTAIFCFCMFCYQGFWVRTLYGDRYIQTIDGFAYVLVHLMKAIALGAATFAIWRHRRLMKAFVKHSWKDPVTALIPMWNQFWVRLAIIPVAYFVYVAIYFLFIIVRARMTVQ